MPQSFLAGESFDPQLLFTGTVGYEPVETTASSSTPSPLPLFAPRAIVSTAPSRTDSLTITEPAPSIDWATILIVVGVLLLLLGGE